MKLCTYRDGSLDGSLMLVSSDGLQAVPATTIAPDLLGALQHWASAEPALRALAQAQALDAGQAPGAKPFDARRRCRARRSGATAQPFSTTAG